MKTKQNEDISKIIKEAMDLVSPLSFAIVENIINVRNNERNRILEILREAFSLDTFGKGKNNDIIFEKINEEPIGEVEGVEEE